MAKTCLKFELLNFRRQFRDWYGSISVLELTTNTQLIKKISEIEIIIEKIINEKTKYK